MLLFILLLCAGLAALGVRQWRRRGPRPVVGLTLGVFDFCHEGHVNLLKRAAAECDRLVVAVHTDAEVRAYKNVQPANSEQARAAAIRDLGLADVVVVSSDRHAVCRKHRVDKVFHGDDWDDANYRARWGGDVMEALGLELVLLPHTPGIHSQDLRKQVPPIGWWLYSSDPDWSRAHIFSHLQGLYEKLGGVWFVSDSGRDLVRSRFPDAPCVLMEPEQPGGVAAEAVGDYSLSVMVTAHFNYRNMIDTLKDAPHPLALVVLSHGRSGKSGTSADVRRQHTPPSGSNPETIGNLTLHDWSYDQGGYLHLDRFLASGGKFENPVPQERPRLLILPTWGPEARKRGLIVSPRWYRELGKLARDCDLWLSPHPLNEADDIRDFVRATGAKVLPPEGHSHVYVPDVHCTLSDLSGVFWEALLFDTPAILADPHQPATWPDDLAPSRNDLVKTVPVSTPETLVADVRALCGLRDSDQSALARQRLGRIDGQATEDLAERIRQLMGGLTYSSR